MVEGITNSGVTHNSYTTVNSGNTRGSSFKLIVFGINGANYLKSPSAKITLATARKFEYFNGRIKPPHENNYFMLIRKQKPVWLCLGFSSECNHLSLARSCFSKTVKYKCDGMLTFIYSKYKLCKDL